MSDRKRLFLIDGHALAYRSYFALSRAGDPSRWITSQGEPTAGTYGFTSVLMRLIEQDAPEFMAVAFDVGKTFRDDLFPEYKGTREKMPEDLSPQIDRIRQVVQAFGIPVLEAEGFEADDVLGTVSRIAAAAGLQVVIITGDRDLLQLADEHVFIQLSGQKISEAQEFKPADVHEKYGVTTTQFVDYKALVGDPSDNIPGVRGIGDKTAILLLNEYGSLDNIYAHIDEIPARYQAKLIESRENAYLSQKLARIVTDVPLEFNLETCRMQTLDRTAIGELFRVLEFRSLLDRLPAQADYGAQMSLFGASSSPVSRDPDLRTIIVDDQLKLDALRQVLEAAELIAFDTETTGTDAMRADLVGISLAVAGDEGYYIPVGHLPGQADQPQLDIDQVIAALRPALTNPQIPKIGHNLKYDYLLLARAGLRPTPLAFDTMIAEWLCNPASRNLGLKPLVWVRLAHEMTPIEDLIGKGRSQRSMAEVSIAEAAPYAAADAAFCIRLKPLLEAELEQKNQRQLFDQVEMPLVGVLAEMEFIGIGLDRSFLKDFSEQLGGRLAELQDTIYGFVGTPFNLNSTQQLSNVLYNELGLQPPDRVRKTASGHYSTAADVLDQMRQAHPIIEAILEYREIAKLKSTYADTLPTQVNPHTGRLHTSYNQSGSVTGRIASSDPNLQNIPIRTELGRQTRRAFIAAPGNMLLGVDYSQIELRVMAHVSEDQAMIQAFLDDLDIHAATAAAVFGVSLDGVTSDMRRQAKAVNFGLMYGMSAYGLTRATDLTLSEAENFVQAYFEQFPGVQQWLTETRSLVVERGFVETLLGRRRYFSELLPGAAGVSEVVRSRALREAINAPIQGSAADIIKLAMLHLPQALIEAGLNARILLQVHDELVLECAATELEKTSQLVGSVMRQAYTLKVPLRTDAKAGPDWSQMVPVD